METSMLAFATDLLDEGTGAVLANVGERAGVDALTLAVAYHAARDVFPHNPVRRVRYLEGGAVFFQPEGDYEESRLRPRVAEVAGAADPLGDLCEAAAGRGMGANAWVVYLHSDRLGFEQPECAPENAFGDRYLTDLCPSHPEVRAYARALTSDISRYGVSAILAESLQFHGLGHGYHHERYFEPLGGLGTYLLGLCFCAHCLAAAGRAGIDAGRVHDSVRGELERLFAGEGDEDSGEPARERLAAVGGGELLGFLEARAQTVTSLAAEVREAAGKDTRLVFLDLSGAEKGFATGEPGGEPAVEAGWRSGINVACLEEVCDTVAATGYASDPGRLRLDLEAYRARLADPSRLGAVLRPMPPDCRSAENLAAKVALARELSLDRLDFYHYGLCRLRSLDWIRESLASS